MTPLTESIIESANADRIFTAQQVKRLVGGSDARCYGLVNRALKAKELIKARRGLYVLANKYRQTPLHLFALAQRWQPGSYISVESALSFHGWIPEAIHGVASMRHGGKSISFSHEVFGLFEFCRMTVKPGTFLQGVARHVLNGQVALVAEPMRALMDLVYLRKSSWNGLGFLVEGLRIDETALRAEPLSALTMLLDVYIGKREQNFIHEFVKVLQA